MAPPKKRQFSDAEESSAELSRLLSSESLRLESPEEDEPVKSVETSILQVNPVSLEVSENESPIDKRPRTVKQLVRKR